MTSNLTGLTLGVSDFASAFCILYRTVQSTEQTTRGSNSGKNTVSDCCINSNTIPIVPTKNPIALARGRAPTLSI